jgi:P-type Cu2+ transporter
LAIAAAVSSSSTPPLSAATVRAANDRKLVIARASDIEDIPGQGVRGTLDGAEVLVGNAALLTDKSIVIGKAGEIGERLATSGRSLVFVTKAGVVLGVLGIADAVRPSSRGAIEELKAMGIEPVLISGDAKATAQRVAQEVGIEKVFAEVRPEQKAAHVQRLQQERRVVAMVGDGINDAPALAQADIGIAIGAGTDVAAQAARVVLMRSDPGDIAKAIRLSKATVRKMKQNLAWASVYNVAAIPVAAGVFYHSLGWSLQPAVSALLMSMSSIVVALNAVSVRRTRI